MPSIVIPPEVWAGIAAVLASLALALKAWANAKASAEKPATLNDVVKEIRTLRETMDTHTSKLDILLDRTPR